STRAVRSGSASAGLRTLANASARAPVWSVKRWAAAAAAGSSSESGSVLFNTIAPRWKCRSSSVAELLGLVQRCRFERGHEREGRTAVVQEPFDRLRAVDKAGV